MPDGPPRDGPQSGGKAPAEGRRDRLQGDAEGAARHGVATPRSQNVAPGSRDGHFGRMFPFLPLRDPGGAAIDELADAMGALAALGESDDNRTISAGYTYLGQFIDHDITFDPTSQFGRDNDPAALANFRTARFDLDSLYGSGPKDQPYLYDWCCASDPGVKLILARSNLPNGSVHLDLQRNEQGRALIGDPRNDENLIVSQLHVLFVRFHNAVVDWLRGEHGLRGDELFDEARRTVRWHYQWIVTHDFLPRVVGDDMARAMLRQNVAELGVMTPAVGRRLYRWRDQPLIPVEFSGAAFRFAHSMVRSTYNLNRSAVSVPILSADENVAPDRHLGGFRPLPPKLKIAWERFFFERNPPASLAVVQRRNHSLKIDELLAAPLFELPLRLTLGAVPEQPDGAPAAAAEPRTTQLARLNLHRGRALGLPAGADVAIAMGQTPLSPTELFPERWDGTLGDEARAALLWATPLWFYILREPEARGTDGKRLGPVGGRIVAEVLVGLLEGDPQSYLRQAPAWTPTLPKLSTEPSVFKMADLIDFTTRSELEAGHGT